MASVGGTNGTMTFAFSNPVAAVGGFLNYAPYSGTASIAVYDASDTLIESFNLTFMLGTGTNNGIFYGFQEETNDISFFVLNNADIGITNLTTDAIPIPGTLWLLGSGLLGLARLRRFSKG